MGSLFYGGEYEIEIDDRALAHLQIAVLSKLRRGEACSFTWSVGKQAGSGRESVWLHEGVALRFRYDSAQAISLNPDWIAVLTATGHRGDIQLLEEPVPAGSA
ncbi:ATP-dependent DNA ligase [Herbiconiux sp. CPCC 203407]|uniref:ATP-dependent DNA ligase n=1 Tax=Herbiconiux oxytropis TaxID=2970915 RepID=A0AA41XI95_9MICO|nr:ATP-dependent DNA ligase [Herbiconiux oxytropis]MCS5723076.1 ATP-dependent DNA ligase [Herbiconiux oxytropis]MCS5726855.1 ATP-dependent DNA ligase [Herbiconiux oxytropis]